MAAAAPAGRLYELRVVQPLAHPVTGDDGQRHLGALLVAQLLDEDVDLAAAREADPEGHIVGDPVGDEARAGSGEHLLRGEDDVALDAAAGNGAGKLALLAHGELGADRPRRRAARGDHGRESDPPSPLTPAPRLQQRFVHAGSI